MKYKLLLFVALALLLPKFAMAQTATATTTPTATATIAGPIPTPIPTFSGQNRTTLGGSSNAVVSNSVANFFSVYGSTVAVALAAEGDAQTVIPLAGHVRNLYCYLSTAGGIPTVAGGTSYVVALRQQALYQGTAASTTALGCTILATAYACSDVVDDVYLGPGAAVDFIDTPAGTPTALVVHCTAELDL